MLTDYEKAIIYKYTNDGYESLNFSLRASSGDNHSELGVYLERTLRKLPAYSGIVYRAANLSRIDLTQYYVAFEDKQALIEPTFLSTTKSRTIAKEFRGNCTFRIVSKTGREIEKIAKFGLYNAQNEQEVLFTVNTRFEVLTIEKIDGLTSLTMEEI